ncbi:MAG: primosomal protein N' [Bryobacterales bacterium]|nr:primosomal protein N' [Bryobacteraceae bacterium]MDW8129296.1 primosomal protein N' [Bryobacterales bacterium]
MAEAEEQIAPLSAHEEPLPLYCEVGLPIPLERTFTYALPETLRHRVRPGCRLLVPFAGRKLVGFVLRCHNQAPEVVPRQVLRLLDEEPALEQDLIELGRWISSYYCAPLGETLRAMAPLAGEVRRGKVYSLTETGREILRRLASAPDDPSPAMQILRLLESRPLSASTIARKVLQAEAALRALERRGFVQAEDVEALRDPFRSPSDRLRVELAGPRPEGKFRRSERELLAYLELHPGSHNLRELEQRLRHAGSAARALARRGLVRISMERPLATDAPERPPHVLNLHQQAAFDAIRAVLREKQFRVFLLQGVTGSGKTEVYLRAIEEALALGRGALLLVPEIALTPAVAAQFFQRFGDRVAILHSAFSDAERADQWRRIRSGAAPVAVGTRSAVFAPVRELGLIVVDEEHDHSYKQEETPRYHGRDVAIVRAQAAGACVVLGSATPSLESRYNAERGKYTLLVLPERIERRPLPRVEIVDMRAEFLETRKQATFSRRLLEEIGARLESGEQTMLLLNRRGFACFAACRACGYRVECVNCAVTLTWHRRDRRLLCHYCNYAEPPPAACPRCSSEYIYYVGAGSERVEEELHRHFPRARVARMDRDTVTGRRQYETILAGFREGRFDILVGTQMIAKGHDIPNVTLVGVVSADVGLGVPDFRAAERTFQLLTQVAGRAGRGELPGLVIIQTINPEHYAIRFAAAQDYELFYRKEVQFRRAMRYPPFSALASILLRSRRQEEAYRMSAELGRFLTPPPEGVKVLGPSEAPVPKLRNEYRYQLLLKGASRKKLGETLAAVRSFAQRQEWPATALVIDVDPVSLL